MKTLSPKHFLLFLACVVSSCSNYEPEGIVVSGLNPPSLVGINLNLNEYPATDIILVQKTTFTYTLSTAGKRLINSSIYVDGQLLLTSGTVTTSFDLNPASLSSGSHRLRIEAVIASETGSLAEKLGAEIIAVWTERNIIVDNTIPEDPSDPNATAILGVENKEGTILVTWNKYGKSNFQSYRLTRAVFDAAGKNTEIIDFGLITNANQTSLADHTYLGGKSVYQVTLTAASQTYASPGITYEHPYKPRLFTSIASNGDATIKWTSAKALRNNLFKYRLDIITDTGPFLQTTSYEKTNAEDTVVTLNIPNFKLGQFKTLKLNLFRSENESYPKLITGVLRLGEAFPGFSPFFPPHLGSDGNYYMVGLGGPGLVRLSPNGVKLDSLRNGYTSIAFARGSSVAVGMVNYTKLNKINLNSLTEESLSNLPNVNMISAISNDLKMIGFDVNDGVKVFSASGQSLLTIGAVEIERVSISPNGEYVSALPRFYKFNGTGFDQWTFTDAYLSNSVSHLENQARVIIGYRDRVVRFNLDSKSIEQTTANYHGPCNFDPVSKKIGCLTNTSFAILNPEDFSLFKSIEVNDPVNNTFYLLNETVLCPGAQIKLSDIP